MAWIGREVRRAIRDGGWSVRQVVHHLRSCAPADFARTLNHPDNGAMTLDDFVSIYEWHGRHHVAHVTALRSKMGR